MTKMKSKRDWYFKYLICLHLSSKSKQSNLSDNIKAMNAGLAIKSLQKAAADVIADEEFVKDPSKDPGVPGEVKLKNSSAASKSIETQGELDLLVEIFLQNGKYKELLSILDDDTRTGLCSRIGNTSGTLKDKIEVLRYCREWKGLQELCSQLLQPLTATPESRSKSSLGQLADDWGIWQAYLEASLQISESEPEKLQRALDLMSKTARHSHSQNALLLLVNHGLEHPTIHLKHGQDVFANCNEYYLAYCAKPFVFRQLGRTSLFPVPQRSSFLSSVRDTSLDKSQSDLGSKYPRRAWLYSEVNSLKLDYFLVISRKGSLKSREPLLNAFIANCLRLYRTTFLWDVDSKNGTNEAVSEAEGPVDRHVGDDAAMLAAMALIHLYFAGQPSALLRTAFVLETVLKQSKHNYEAVLLAVRVYLHMGQFGRAFELFNGLDVKNIQNLSTLWILICRISTLHPHASRRMRCDPSANLDEAADWIAGSFRSIRRACAECLKHKSYRNFLKTVETFESLPTSISKIMIEAEDSKILWLTATGPVADATSGAFDGSKHPDNREITAFANYEHPSQPTMDVRLRPGPLPQANWCRSQQRFQAICQICIGHPLQPEDASDISALFSQAAQSIYNDPEDMTIHEMLDDQLYRVYFDLCMLAGIAKDQGQLPEESKHAQIIKRLEELSDGLTNKNSVRSTLPDIKIGEPDWYMAFNWSCLHAIYQRFYTLKFLLATLRFLAMTEHQWNINWGQEKNELLQKAQSLEGSVRRTICDIKEWSRAVGNELKESKTSASIMSSLLGKSADKNEGLKMLDDAKEGDPIFMGAKDFSAILVSGWIDTLDGFEAVDEDRL